MSERVAESVETTVDAPTFTEAGPLAVPQNRGVNGKFLPGNNANPGGRPKGLAAYVRQRTGDGKDVVDYVVRVLKDKGEETRLRLQAAEWLADRGFGRPVQSHEVTGEGGGEVIFRLKLGERE